MENHYAVLECQEDSSLETIKKNYQRLALKYHPDKQITYNDSDIPDCEHFVKVRNAWTILSDVVLRTEFDIKWKQRCLIQDWPIQDEVDIDEFEEEDEDDAETGRSLTCRCGGLYTLSKTDITLHFDIVCCDTCSLAVKVIYRSDSAQDVY